MSNHFQAAKKVLEKILREDERLLSDMKYSSLFFRFLYQTSVQQQQWPTARGLCEGGGKKSLSECPYEHK